jgi:hypothetical protein
MNIKDFFLGQKLIAKETIWSRSHDGTYIPRILLIEGKEYEVKHVNDHGGHNKIYSIATKTEFDIDSNWPINDDDFPFYTTQELRDKKLEELGLY